LCEEIKSNSYTAKVLLLKEHEEKNKGDLMLDALKLFRIGSLGTIPNYQGILQLGPINLKYRIYKEYTVEYRKFTERKRPDSFMHLEMPYKNYCENTIFIRNRLGPKSC
jgi:hypothetical protein